MISQALAHVLSADPSLGLKLGTSLFAESATGSQYVLVRLSYESPVGGGLPTEFRRSNIQIVVYGWPVEAGNKLAEKILRTLELSIGPVTTPNGDVHTIKAVRASGLPVFVNYGDFRAWSLNVAVTHHANLTL